MRIVLTGGGTGGHIFPLVAVSQELKKIAVAQNIPQVDFLFLGADIENKKLIEALSREGVVMKKILSGKMRRYFSIKNFTDLIKTFLGFFQVLYILFRYMPDVVFSKGGEYGSFLVVFVSWLFRVPVVIHESDSVPGLSNRFSKYFATRIAVSFSKTLSYFPIKKTALVGNPVRGDIIIGNKEEAKKIFNLEEGIKTILIIGGSQGSEKINELIIESLNDLISKYQIIHSVGLSNFEEYSKEVDVIISKENSSRYHLYPFLTEELKNAYAVCDLIVSRSGSNIFEFAAVGKPSVLIPLFNSGSDHQKENAYQYAQSGAAIVIEEQNLTPHTFFQVLDRLLINDEKLLVMSKAALEFNLKDSAAKIAEEILKLAKAIIV